LFVNEPRLHEANVDQAVLVMAAVLETNGVDMPGRPRMCWSSNQHWAQPAPFARTKSMIQLDSRVAPLSPEMACHVLLKILQGIAARLPMRDHAVFTGADAEVVAPLG
jgi:hypothetical protein